MRRLAATAAVAVAVSVAIASCIGGAEATSPGRTRGYLLIAISGLRADLSGTAATPEIDSLARRAVRFDRAIAPAPSTLAAQLSLATGLWPPEHGARPPLGLLSSQVPTLAERFSDAGFHTAGFTEGGFVSSIWGFDRGFDTFTDPPDNDSFGRAADFLATLAPGERFFLFVHTAEPAARPPDGPLATPDEALRRYAAAVERLDQRIGMLVAALDRGGLRSQTTIVLTADHGLELGEHGETGHRQLYPEVIRVPLLIAHPAVAGGRTVERLVRTVDVAPTLATLARLPPSRIAGGRPLVAEIAGSATGSPPAAYAESGGWTPQRSLVIEEGERTWQLVRSGVRGDSDGGWVSRSVRFDAIGPELSFRIVSYAVPRLVTLTLDGRPLAEIATRTRWSSVSLTLPPQVGRYRLRLATDDCTRPRSLGNGSDPRCLSFKIQGIPLGRTELFDLRTDPGALDDLSAAEPETAHRLAALLDGLVFSPPAPPEKLRPSGRVSDALRRLGYLDSLETE